MKHSIHILITICLFVSSSNFMTKAAESVTLEPSEALLTTTTAQENEPATVSEHSAKSEDKKEAISEQRSIDFHGSFEGAPANEDRHAAFRRRAKPLKNIFLGLYKNYKSTYLGNTTLMEYKQAMRNKKDQEAQSQSTDIEDADSSSDQSEASTESADELNEEIVQSTEATSRPIYPNDNEKVLSAGDDAHEKLPSSKKKRKKQRLRKHNNRRIKNGKGAHAQQKADSKQPAKSKTAANAVYSYDFGHGYNMSLDMSNDIVNLHLDGDNLRDLMQGRLLNGESEGRGKKYEMITRVLPLFIIPFLIQSAVVPFLVTKLKLLLMKSILVGKLAIFLLIISAIKNGNKMMQTYEVAPSYWAGEPSRRSELAAAASAAAYNGYRVEGKPTAWIN